MLVGRQLGGCQDGARHGTAGRPGEAEPLQDGVAVIGEAVYSYHGVSHDLLPQGADAQIGWRGWFIAE